MNDLSMHANTNNNNICILHLFSFKTPILQSKKIRKKCKINSRNFTYDGLTFSSSFWIFEEVKDEICVLVKNITDALVFLSKIVLISLCLLKN